MEIRPPTTANRYGELAPQPCPNTTPQRTPFCRTLLRQEGFFLCLSPHNPQNEPERTQIPRKEPKCRKPATILRSLNSPNSEPIRTENPRKCKKPPPQTQTRPPQSPSATLLRTTQPSIHTERPMQCPQTKPANPRIHPTNRTCPTPNTPHKSKPRTTKPAGTEGTIGGLNPTCRNPKSAYN